MNYFLHRHSLMLLLGLCPALSALGVDNEAEKFVSVSGFGTVGAVFNSTDKADFMRTVFQKDGAGNTHRVDFGIDSLLGLQLDVTPSQTLKGTAQVVSHQRSDGTYLPELTWAFAKYTPNDNMALQLGRLGFDAYMLADSRNVGYSFQWVRPPVEFFGLLPTYFDGADLIFMQPVGMGIASVKLFAGKAREKFLLDAQNYIDLNGSQLRGGFAEYQTKHWLYRLGYSQQRFAHDAPGVPLLIDGLRSAATLLPTFGMNAEAALASAYADDAELVGKVVKYMTVGVVYEDGPLQVQLKFARSLNSSPIYPSNNAGYLSIGYRSGKWKPYLTYSAIDARNQERTTGLPAMMGLDPLIDGAHQLYVGNLVKQNTVTVGMRYDFMQNADIKFQLDRVHSQHPLLWRNVDPSWNGNATLLSIAVDFVF